MGREKYLRVRSGTLQTPILNFKHTSTDSRISLIGMIHIGSQKYYNSVAEHVASTEDTGNIVHYEKLVKPSEGEQITFPEGIDDIVAFTEDMRLPLDIAARHLNVVRQINALDYRPHWENHDISFVDFATMLGPDELAKMIESVNILRRMHAKHPILTGMMLKTGLWFMPLLTRLNDSDTHREYVVVHHRNKIALDAVNERITTEPDRSITMLWGAGHLTGISEGLKLLGYHRITVHWLDALPLVKRPSFSTR